MSSLYVFRPVTVDRDDEKDNAYESDDDLNHKANEMNVHRHVENIRYHNLAFAADLHNH